MKEMESMKKLTVALIVLLYFAIPVKLNACSSDAAECLPPVITNLQDGDTLVTDHCNKLSYQFEADPGGVGGNGTITGWTKINGAGDINSNGLYCFYRSDVGTYSASVEVTNDCGAADTCSFYVRADAEKEELKAGGGGIMSSLFDRLDYVFGPEGAESVTVWIETDGTTAELEATGIKFRRSFIANTYSSQMSVKEYELVKNLPSVVRVTLVRRQKLILNSVTSPSLDTSTVYFRADTARTEYHECPPLSINRSIGLAVFGHKRNQLPCIRYGV